MNAGPRAAAMVRRARRGVLLSEALAESGAGRRVDLDGGQRLQILDNLIASLGGAYAHLPAKRAAYATDPVQALILLRRRAADLSDTEFNRAVSAIITGLRDAHTRYIGPSTLRDQVAVLPFLVEQYGPESRPKYLVSKINTDVIDNPEFEPGIELEAWNGAPFARAVENHADLETGGRSDSRRARALESLTFRALDYGPPPDEHWVIVGYRTKRGRKAEIRLPWRLLTPGKAATALEPGSRAALKQASDPSAEAVRRAKKLVFAPDLWASDHDRRPAAPGRARRRSASGWIRRCRTCWPPGHSAARSVILRIWSFDLDDDDAFINELIRLLGLLPQTGLIVDLRANPGGLIWAAERALQLFTDVPIQPTRFSLIAAPLTRQMADSPFNRLELEAWSRSLQDAVSTGEFYAQPLPLTDPSWCNDKGRKYLGPSVAVVDANTYSSGDLFAAGWVDHGIGPLVSVGQATGAGGANVWTSAQLRDALSGTDHQQPRMPAGTGFTMAFRRAIRSGTGDGIPIEDLGIPGIPYEMSKGDLMHGNKDLLAFLHPSAGRRHASEEMIMVEFDPGPPPEVAEHFAGVPSYAPHRDLFWYDWGPVFYRGRLDGSARVLCIASDPGPTERVAGRTLVGDAGQRVQGFLHKLGLSRSYACVNAYAYALLPSRSLAAIPILSEPEQRSWRNELFSMIIGPALQAIVTFGLQARIAVEQWTDAPAGHDQESASPLQP